jgi:hypothetical protein
MFRDFMIPKNRVEQLLQEVKEQAKEMGVNVEGYQPQMARSGKDVLAFVFYPTGNAKLDKFPILIQLKRTEPSVEIYTPYTSSNYGIQKMLWGMGADGHCFHDDLEKTCVKN